MSIDMEEAVADIGASLGFGEPKEAAPNEPQKEPEVIEGEPPAPDLKPSDPKIAVDPKTVVDPKVAIDPAAPVARAMPGSIPKDKAELWAKMPSEVQDLYVLREKQMLDGLEAYKEHNAFGKQVKDVYAPYRAILNAQGLDEIRATQSLLNAHFRLTQGSPEQRAAAYQQLGVNLGLVQQGEQPNVDPAMRQLMERQAKIEAGLNDRAQREFNETRTRIGGEVQAFAQDPQNHFFDEVADDIVSLIHAAHARGQTPNLKSIYDQAVWANPVTRAKLQAQSEQETEKKLREKSEQEAKAAREAKSANVRSRDTKRAPTEPLGSMEDTMRETLGKIRNRAH